VLYRHPKKTMTDDEVDEGLCESERELLVPDHDR
jgi:hypothetical protein